MKAIAIISAMDVEINSLIKKINATKIENNIWKSKINDKNIFIMVSGIGKSNIAHAITYLHLKYNIDYVLNIGVAGAVKSIIKPFDVIEAMRVAHYDFDLTAFGYKTGQVPGYNQFFIPNLHIFKNILSGEIVSADKFARKEEVEEITKKFKNAVAVDMESASFGQIATKLNLKWAILRIISDNGKDHSNVEQYNKNKKEASKYLNSIIINAVRQIC